MTKARTGYPYYEKDDIGYPLYGKGDLYEETAAKKIAQVRASQRARAYSRRPPIRRQ